MKIEFGSSRNRRQLDKWIDVFIAVVCRRLATSLTAPNDAQRYQLEA
jgi:hypothetical protein